LDVDVNVPDMLDLSAIRSKGQQPGEELLPDTVEASTNAAANELNEKAMQLSESIGITPYQARYSLQRANNDMNAAAEWFFMNMDDIPPEEAVRSTPKVLKQEKTYQDGSSHYKLRGFITHMGSSPHSGHYVCHLLRNGIWYLYNDEKVAVSQNPPKSLGYIYLYERAGQ
jgi:ubiquitin carboxyl-terminal hydrolase 5/13